MDEEIRRSKYRRLQSRLYSIKNKLNDLRDCYDDMLSSVKEGIMINGSVACEEMFEEIKDDVNEIRREIVNEVIPRVNNKI